MVELFEVHGDDGLWSEEREPWEALVARTAAFLQLLESHKAQRIVVVTHSDFLEALFHNSPVDIAEDLRGLMFANCDVHSVVLSRA
jgi:broad specificity phosphatase PhoE